MYCRNCGKQIDDGVSFCPECGAKVGAPAEQTQNDTPASIVKTAGERSPPTRRSAPTAAPRSNRRTKADQRFGHCGLCALPHLAVGRFRLRRAHRRAHSECHRRCAARKYSSNGFATAGLVISIVTLVFWALMVALIVTGVVTGFFDAFFDAVYPSGAAA